MMQGDYHAEILHTIWLWLINASVYHHLSVLTICLLSDSHRYTAVAVIDNRH